MEKTKKNKKNFSFPSAFTVLFIVLLIAQALTYLVPAGSFSRLSYNKDESVFEIVNPQGETSKVKATQDELDKRNISIPLKSFENGDIFKPVAIPGSYERMEQHPQGFVELLKAPIAGIEDSVGIIVFVLVLGGNIGVLNAAGAFDAGISALSRKVKGKEYLLIIIISSIIALGGTTFGLAEETIAFYPILMPIFLAMGYDAMTCIATIFMGTCIGTMFSTTNAFSVVIASNAAGISFKTGLPFRIISLIIAMILTLIYIIRYAQKVKKDPTKSIVYDDREKIEERFLKDYDPSKEIPFTTRRILMLLIFTLAFPIMIYGVSSKSWWFEEMSALFLLVGIILIVISGLGEKKAVGAFLSGSSDLVSVALIIGVARGINLIMDQGLISDTLLNGATNVIRGMNGVVFSTVQFFLFSFLGIFIPSSSGLATLSMPIVAPLADTVNIGREVIVSAYNHGQGWMAFITPTGLVIATLELVDVSFDKWLKFIIPLMAIIGIFTIVMLGIEVMI